MAALAFAALLVAPRAARPAPSPAALGGGGPDTDTWPHAEHRPLAVQSAVDAEFRFRGSQARHINVLQANQEDLVRGVFQRIRLGARFRTRDLDAYLQLQSASVLGEAGPVQFRPPGAAASSPGDIPIPVGLQQGRLRWRAPWLEELEIEVGRMALSYGKGRQIGRYDFHESGNAFDGLRLHYGMRDYLDVDALAVKLRRNTAHPEKERNLLGVYITSRPVERLQSDLYFLWVTDGAEDVRSDLQTLGLRVEWRPWKWLDLEGEGALQVGTQQPAGASKAMDHFATMAVGVVRVSRDLGLPVALELSAQQLSGNDAVSKDQVRAWHPLYPNLDEHVGLLQLFNQTNLRQLLGSLQVGGEDKPHMRLTYRLNASVAGTPLPAFFGPTLPGEQGWVHVGDELDARAVWPLFGSSELLVAGGVFMPSQALADKIGRAWSRIMLIQWSSVF